MTTAIDFPSTLPGPSVGTISGTATEPWVNDPSEVGATRRRARFTRALQRWSFSVVYTSAQLASLYVFYETTLKNGVLSFNWTHPDTGVSHEVLFSGRPQSQHIQASAFRVSIGLEEL